APGATYFVRVGPHTCASIRDVAPQLLVQHGDPIDPSGVLISFATTSDPTLFFTGIDAVAPTLVATDPVDGATGISPNLYSDPGKVLPPPRSYTLRFDGPVQPAATNVGDGAFLLIDLDDTTAAFPGGVELGIDVSVLENERDHALVQVTPHGILPFGHLL